MHAWFQHHADVALVLDLHEQEVVRVMPPWHLVLDAGALGPDQEWPLIFCTRAERCEDPPVHEMDADMS